MNLYIRTLGFDNMTSEAEAKFIKTGIVYCYHKRNAASDGIFFPKESQNIICP